MGRRCVPGSVPGAGDPQELPVARLKLGLVSPALSLDSWSRAMTSELATSGTDDCARKRGVICRKRCS